MTTTSTNRDMVIIDSHGNVYVIYPTTVADGVLIDPSINPVVIDSSIVTLNQLLSVLGKLAFKTAIYIEDLDSSVFPSDEDDDDEKILKLASYGHVISIKTELNDVEETLKSLPTQEAFDELKQNLNDVKKTQDIIKVAGEGFSTLYSWSDGNPTNIDRSYNFVTHVSGERLVRIATTGDIPCGVSMPHYGIITNAVSSYIDNEENISRSSAVVTIIGPAIVQDQGTCEPGDYCICGADGRAIKSESGIGHYVIARKSVSTILINFNPNAELIDSLNTKIKQLEESIAKINTTIEELPSITHGVSDPTGGKSGDVYVKYDV